jgi:hypothetical protein
MARFILRRKMNTIPAVKSTNARPKEARLFTWLAIASGIMLTGALVAWPPVHRRNASTHWPSTKGVISAAGLKVYFQKPYTEPIYELNVSYSYVVDGIPRVGTRISFADSIRTFRKDTGLVWLSRNYPVGKPVTVYYDRADPDFSVLEPGAQDLVLIWRWVSGALAFCFLLALWMRRRAMRRSSAPLPEQ